MDRRIECADHAEYIVVVGTKETTEGFFDLWNRLY